ncbi:MAG TPA: hypothetical protein VIH42_08035 [Thermoguttaceae bacterium]
MPKAIWTRLRAPVFEQWDGTGIARICIYKPSTAEWFLGLNGDGMLDSCQVDVCPGPFGIDSVSPVVGKW